MRSQEEATEEETPPSASVDPTGEVTVHGEYVSKEAQEGKGGGGRRRGCSRRVGGVRSS